MKNIFYILITLFIIAACFFLFYFFKNKDKRITLYGNVEIRQSDLAFRVSGRLLKLYKEEGDEVKEGELLAEIDSDTYKTSLRETKAKLREKKAQRDKKTANYKFNFPLCKDFIISKEKCSDLFNEMQYAKGEYDEAVANLEKSIINLDDTKLYAPYNGIVLTRIREKGTILSANDPVYSISMIEPVWVRAYIDETNLGNIKLGQNALVYTDARPNNPYKAHVGFISPVAEFTPKTVETTTLRVDLVYRLRIIIDDVDSYLRQGMPVTVKIENDKDNT